MQQQDQYVRVGLLMRPDSGFYRGVLRGIKRYSQQQRNWVFGMAARTQDLPTMLKVWKPAGVVWPERKTHEVIKSSLQLKFLV